MSVLKDEQQQQSLQHLALWTARASVLGMALSLPVARAVFNICALLMIAGWLLSGRWQEKFTDISKSPTSLACVAFFVLSCLSLLWTESIGPDQWSALKGYSRLLYVPLIVSLITTAQWQRRAWTALSAGMLFLLAIFILDIWLEIPGTRTYGTHTAGQGVFHHHIAEGMVLSFLGAYALHKSMSTSTRQKSFWLLVSAVTVTGLFWVGQSRTAQVSVVAAYFLVLLTHLPERYRIKSLLFAFIVFCLLIGTSSRVQERFAEGLEELSSFEENGERTSVGARLKAWQFSADLISDAKWLGYGAGSYRQLAYNHFGGSQICGLGVCEQPHNQFIVTAIEMGMAGMISLGAIMAAALLFHWQKKSSMSVLSLPFMAIFVLTALMDSSLKIQAQSFFFITTLGILVAQRE